MSLFKEHLYAMAPYTPPLEGRSVAEHLLLDFNERTLPVSDAIVRALCDYIQSGQLQKYPSYGDITQKLAAYTGVDEDQLMITNGSDQGIDLVIRSALDATGQAIIPGPSFAIYEQCASVENAEIISPQYDPERGYPGAEVLSAIGSNTRLIVIASPNNPSGTRADPKDVKRILQTAPHAVVLVDECYFEYSGATVVGLVAEYPNLVVTRTFSKTWGLPSLRFGFLVSQADNIKQLLKVRGPYDINQLAVIAAGAALAEPEYTKNYASEVMGEAKPLLEAWFDSRHIAYWPSSANYLWAFPPKARELANFLQTRGILVRPKKNRQDELGLRITVGNLEQTKRLITELESFPGQEPVEPDTLLPL